MLCSIPVRFTVLVAVPCWLAACSGDSEPEPLEQCFEPTLLIDVCDPAGNFSIDSVNELFPLDVGAKTVIEGEEEDELVRVELTVLDQTEVVNGVTTRVVEAREYIDDELYEIALDFYAVASDGTVCYFGEDVEFYEGGEVVNHDGTWRAGINGARPGIIMPASPQVGQSFFQESAPDVAIDMSRVDAIGLSVDLAGQTYDNVVRLMDSNPIDGQEGCDEEEEKLFVPGIGLAGDTVKRMISHTPAD